MLIPSMAGPGNARLSKAPRYMYLMIQSVERRIAYQTSLFCCYTSQPSLVNDACPTSAKSQSICQKPHLDSAVVKDRPSSRRFDYISLCSICQIELHPADSPLHNNPPTLISRSLNQLLQNEILPRLFSYSNGRYQRQHLRLCHRHLR